MWKFVGAQIEQYLSQGRFWPCLPTLPVNYSNYEMIKNLLIHSHSLDAGCERDSDFFFLIK